MLPDESQAAEDNRLTMRFMKGVYSKGSDWNPVLRLTFTRGFSMKKIMLSLIAVICLAGFSSFSFADEMGKMKEDVMSEKNKMKEDVMGEMGQMKADVKSEKDKIKGDVTGKKDKMKAGVKGKADEMKGKGEAMKKEGEAMKGEMKGTADEMKGMMGK